MHGCLIYVWMPVHMYLYAYPDMHECIDVFMYVMYACINIHRHTHESVSIYMHTSMYKYKQSYSMYVCRQVCVHVCI